MKKGRKKIRQRKRKCSNCGELYRPDVRSKGKQKYCSSPECRKASQAESWGKWFNRPENRDYYKGSDQVERTREWRRQNPGYWRRVAKAENALPNVITVQSVDAERDASILASDALPKDILSQPALMVGLIASLTGSALPKDIAKSSRKFLDFGQDILGIGPGIEPKGGRDDEKTHYMPRAAAAGAATVQLGGSPPDQGRAHYRG